MPANKTNHIIPCCLLRQWETTKMGRPGVFQYNIKKKKTNFAESQGKGKFSFAASTYFYVPLVNNERKPAVEKWFSGMESDLAAALAKLSVKTEGSLLSTREEATRFMMAIFSLKHRTEFAINSIRKYVDNNPDIKKKMNVDENRDVELIVLENMISAITNDANEYTNYEMIVWRNESGSLIIGDQPFLGELVEGFMFLVLSPYYYITFKRINSSPYFTYMETDYKFIHLVNQSIARHSRKWIVASNETILQKYIPFADEEKNQDEEPQIEIPKFIISGYKIE